MVWASGMSGFVWMMEGSGAPSTGNTEAKIGGDPCHVANLTVWESVETLEASVFNTVHKQFFARRAKWFEVLEQMHFVMWWVPKGHCPGLDEVLAPAVAAARAWAQRDCLWLGVAERGTFWAKQVRLDIGKIIRRRAAPPPAGLSFGILRRMFKVWCMADPGKARSEFYRRAGPFWPVAP